MGSNLSSPLTIYPMVEENEATGRVAAVYSHLRDEMPFVPSLFKSLAVCPAHLVLAYEQAAPMLQSPEFRSAAEALTVSVSSAAEPPGDAEVCETLASFVDPLGRMLLLSAGLLAALDGGIDAAPCRGSLPEATGVDLQQPAPSQWDAPATQVYGRIRADLDTPLINSIWRVLAGKDLLEAAWSALSRQVQTTRAEADQLQSRTVNQAHELPWRVAATPTALATPASPMQHPASQSSLTPTSKPCPASSPSSPPATAEGSCTRDHVGNAGPRCRCR